MKRRGRPPAGEGPPVKWEQVAEVMRHGELRRQHDGTVLRVRVSLRELAARHGVSPSLLCRFAKREGIVLRSQPERRTQAERKPAARRGRGRPAADAVPTIDWDAVERRLIHGDLRRFANGRAAYVIPSSDDLAEELGVDASLVRRVARDRKVKEQRETATALVPMRLPREEADRALKGDLHVSGFRSRIPRIADIYAAYFEEDLQSGEVRRGEASTLERLSKLALDVERQAPANTEDPMTIIARLIRERGPGIEARRRYQEEHPELSGMVIDTEPAPVNAVPVHPGTGA